MNAYARVRRLAPAWRAWWRFHVTCDVARDRVNRLGEDNAKKFFLVAAVFGKWRTSVLGARRARTERDAAAVDAKAAELNERERTLDATAGAIIGEHVDRTNVALRRALRNEESVVEKLRLMELELREKDAAIEGNERAIATLLEDARAFEATLARRAVEAARADREILVAEHEREVDWLRAAVERAFEECVWYRKRYGAVDCDDDLHAFLARIAGTDRAREMLPKGSRRPWVESFAPKRDQLATRTGGPKQRSGAGGGVAVADDAGRGAEGAEARAMGRRAPHAPGHRAVVPVVDVESGRRRFERRRFVSGVWKKGWHLREAAGVGSRVGGAPPGVRARGRRVQRARVGVPGHRCPGRRRERAGRRDPAPIRRGGPIHG